MHRFFVNQEGISDNQIEFDDKESRHISKILRLKPGDIVGGFDALGQEYNILLKGAKGQKIWGEILSIDHTNNEIPVPVGLIQGVAKGEKMDTIIRKAVEIGVDCIYPVSTTYTVVKIKENKQEGKIARWRNIALEACKQCRRNYIPPINPVNTLGKTLELLAEQRLIILLYENEKSLSLQKIITENYQDIMNRGVYIIIGPEGGFAPEEVKEAQAKGVLLAGLESRILRTETAGLVAASIIIYATGGFE